MDNRSCPACNFSAGLNRGERNGFHVLSCQSCHTLYTARLPDAKSAQDYNTYYDSRNLSVPASICRRLDEIVAQFSGYRHNNRLLDVGFGAGSLLQTASRAGWTVEGVEVSQSALRHAQGIGLSTFCGELAEARYPTEYFDVVVASELLEHVPDPGALVREVARILRSGGLFWATTPHGGGISARLLGLQWSVISPPEHLHVFSVGGIRTLLNLAGFRRIHVVTHGVNPCEILHILRKGLGTHKTDGSFNRVESGYRLNAFLSEGSPRRALKVFLNGLLSASGLGDSLKIRAETRKPVQPTPPSPVPGSMTLLR
jgi:SAM-dependent methyltransferase